MAANQQLGRVLVVDDEENVRTNLRRFLNEAGYYVRVAESSTVALRLAEIEAFDFAIVDLEFGHHASHGVEVAKFIARLKPKAKMIMLSAESKDASIAARLEQIVPPPEGYVWVQDPKSNFITDTVSELKRLSASREKRKCFVIMPFSTTASHESDVWDDIFENGIKKGVEQSGLYVCKRSSPLAGTSIIREIFDELNSAEIVIADLTDRNANVFYELGVRHTLRDEAVATILITQQPDKVPFDIQSIFAIGYSWKTELAHAKLRADLATAVEAVAEAIANQDFDRIRSPVRALLVPPTRSAVVGK